MAVIDDDVELLERQAQVRPGASPTIYNKVNLSLGDVDEPGTFFLWPEGRHPFKVVSVEEAVGKPKDDGFGGTKPGTPYVLIKLECLEGPCAGMTIEDRLMLAGKGLGRLKMALSAMGLLNEAGNFTGCWADFLAKKVWVTIETENGTYNGKATQRSKVAFAGYEPFEAWQFAAEDGALTQEEPPKVGPSGTPPWKQ